MKKSLYILYIGQFVTKICSVMSYMAILWWFSSFADGAIYIGIFSAISLIPSVSLPAFVGVLLDRFNRRNAIVISDIISGINLLFIALLISGGISNINYIYILVFVSSCCGTVFTSAVEPLYYDIISQNEYPKIMSIKSILAKISSIIAPILAGILINSVGVKIVLIIEGTSYIISGISEIFIKTNQKIIKEKLTTKNFYTDLKEVLAFIFKTKILAYILLIGFVVNFFTAPIMPMLPLFVKDILVRSVKEVGMLQTAMSIGTIIASLYIGFIRRKELTTIEYSLPFMLSGIFLIIFSINKIFIIALILFVFVSLTFGVSNFINDLLIQYNVSSENRTRVLSLFSYIQFMQPISLSLAGIVSKFLGVQALYFAAGLMIIFAGFFILIIPEFKKAKEIVFSN